MSVWLAVRDYEGIYEVSSDGRVRSVLTGRELKPGLSKNGRYLRVNLSKAGQVKTVGVHQLVAAAFIGPCPPGMEVRHWPINDSLNNSVANLTYGTHAQNERDKVAHGTNINAAKTHCKRGHPLEGANLRLTASGRTCRACVLTNYVMAKHPEWRDRFQEIADGKYARLTRTARVDTDSARG